MKYFVSALGCLLGLGATLGSARVAAAGGDGEHIEKVEEPTHEAERLEERAAGIHAAPVSEEAEARARKIAEEHERDRLEVRAQEQRRAEAEMRRRAILEEAKRRPAASKVPDLRAPVESPVTSGPQWPTRDTTTPLLLFAKSPEIYASARRGARLLADPKRRANREVPLIIYDKTGQPPKAVRASLSRRLAKVELIHSIPANAFEAGQAHGEAVASLYSDAAWAALNKLPQLLGPDALDLRDGKAHGETYAKSLSRRLLEAKSEGVDLVMVVGDDSGAKYALSGR